jgi:hypothetical protein
MKVKLGEKDQTPGHTQLVVSDTNYSNFQNILQHIERILKSQSLNCFVNEVSVSRF